MNELPKNIPGTFQEALLSLIDHLDYDTLLGQLGQSRTVSFSDSNQEVTIETRGFLNLPDESIGVKLSFSGEIRGEVIPLEIHPKPRVNEKGVGEGVTAKQKVVVLMTLVVVFLIFSQVFLEPSQSLVILWALLGIVLSTLHSRITTFFRQDLLSADEENRFRKVLIWVATFRPLYMGAWITIAALAAFGSLLGGYPYLFILWSVLVFWIVGFYGCGLQLLEEQFRKLLPKTVCYDPFSEW